MARKTRRAAKGQRSHMGCGAALVVAAVVFIGVSIISAVVYALAPQTGPTASTPFLPKQPGSITWDGRSPLTVLLLGQNGRNQSAAITVGSYSPGTRSIELLSVPASLWVTVPGAGQATLGSAYADGGASLTLLLVQNIIHAVIPYYAVIDEHTLARAIDDLGGIEPARTGTPGTRHESSRQDGAATIGYLSHVGKIDQMWRQQEVMIALLRRAGGPSQLFRLPVLLATFGGQVQTNIPYGQMPALARILMAVPDSRIGHHALDFANNAVSNYMASGDQVLLPDWQQISVIAHQVLGRTPPSPRAHVKVLNGAGIAGQASEVARLLRDAGIRVDGVGSAASFNLAHTRVVIGREAPPGPLLEAHKISTLLQVPLELSVHEGDGARIQVLIGHDFVDPGQQ